MTSLVRQHSGGRSVHDRPPAALRVVSAPRHAEPALCATWHFRLIHLIGLLLMLPVVAVARLWPGRKRSEESVFVETNRAVLTALGFAFMS